MTLFIIVFYCTQFLVLILDQISQLMFTFSTMIRIRIRIWWILNTWYPGSESVYLYYGSGSDSRSGSLQFIRFNVNLKKALYILQHWPAY